MSGDSGTKRSVSPKPREGKVRFEKESNKETRPTSPKKEPKSYAFFSQEVAVTVENPQKRVRGERSQPSSNMMGQPAWETCRRLGDDRNIANWFVTDSFKAEELKELIDDKRTFRHLFIDVISTTATPVDKSTVRISMDMDSEKNALYLATDTFSILDKLEGGKSYTRLEIAELAMDKMSTKCINTMKKNEAFILADNVDANKRRLYWIVWREAALLNILVYKEYMRLYQDSTKLDTFDKWLGLAGLDRECKRIQPIAPSTMWFDIRQASVVFQMNVELSMTEMIKLTCQALLEASGSFNWLSDVNIISLIGMPAEAMLQGKEPNLALVTAEICFLIKGKHGNRMALGELYNVLSKLTSGTDTNALYGMSESSEWLFADVCTQAKDTPPATDEGMTSMSEHINNNDKVNSDVSNCNKIVVRQSDDAPHYIEHTEIEVTDKCTFNAETLKAISKDDMSQLWIADSGATKHMTSHKEWLSELKRVTTGVQCGAG